MTVTEPAWRALHELWWMEQRQPQPGDLDVAWEALWEVVPTNGWIISRPTHDARLRHWQCTAIRLRSGSKVRPEDIVLAIGPTEPAVIVELARCISLVRDGLVPR